jgi:hypothetical protein
MRPARAEWIGRVNHFWHFSIVADMAENPEGFRTDVKKALLDLTDDYNLPGIPPDTAKEARDTAKQIINGILAGGKP